MNYNFTPTQLAKIQSLQYEAEAKGYFSDVYGYIASLLPNSAEKRWFVGAQQANSGNGVFSVLIREYSIVQMNLRGVPVSAGIMQLASN